MNAQTSANGYLLELDGYTLRASWPAPFFALCRDDPEAANYDPEPMLFHCETRDCAERHLRYSWDTVLDGSFEAVA
jgi:hypothetical protein